MPVEPSGEKVRTTVTLPREVYDEVRSLIEEKATPSRSVTAFLATAIAAYLKLLKRKRIDAEFASMAADAAYQKQARLLSQEFSSSDWEAFAQAEKDI
ncbi:MAG TPA: hypothetical protein VEG64_03050 [Candidatus Sulfotelmatobacter sp.]|nr:hypothetical protein [Candidatus Sulfotelmatobacter sp.]